MLMDAMVKCFRSILRISIYVTSAMYLCLRIIVLVATAVSFTDIPLDRSDDESIARVYKRYARHIHNNRPFGPEIHDHVNKEGALRLNQRGDKRLLVQDLKKNNKRVPIHFKDFKDL